MVTKQAEIIIEAHKKGYRISENGEIVSPSGRKLKGRVKQYYLEFCIRFHGKVRYVPVHRMVAYQKYGDIVFSCDCVRHLDGNRLNNSWDNIEIGTTHDNMMDIPYEIRKRKAIIASHSHSMKWDENDVKKIKEFYNEVRSYTKTMEKFGIKSKSSLHFILHKR